MQGVPMPQPQQGQPRDRPAVRVAQQMGLTGMPQPGEYGAYPPPAHRRNPDTGSAQDANRAAQRMGLTGRPNAERWSYLDESILLTTRSAALNMRCQVSSACCTRPASRSNLPATGSECRYSNPGSGGARSRIAGAWPTTATPDAMPGQMAALYAPRQMAPPPPMPPRQMQPSPPSPPAQGGWRRF